MDVWNSLIKNDNTDLPENHWYSYMVKNKFNLVYFDSKGENSFLLTDEIKKSNPNFYFDVVHIRQPEEVHQQVTTEVTNAILVNIGSHNGMNDLRQITKTLGGEVPIIVVSSEGEEEMAISALQYGAQDYVLKEQIDSDSLFRSVRYAWEIHQLNGRLKKNFSIQQHLTLYDQLTDLPNRQLFDRLFQALAHAKRSGLMLAIMYLDINNFKLINDAIGHRAGDMILKNVASRLSCCVRDSDTVARMGSDEFAFIINDITETQDIVHIAQKIISNVTQPIILSGNKDSVTACLGISVYPTDSDDAEILVRNAELAYQRAKLNAMNSFQFYNSSLDKKAVERIELEQDLRFALSNNELHVYYQPQFDIRKNKLVGFEALMRWIHPQQGFISPAIFIPIAEETGLIIQLGHYILKTACAQMQEWHEKGHPDLRIAVNLAARQFRDESLPQIVKDVLQETRLQPRSLELEITESNAMDSVDHTIAMLSHFIDMEVRLSLDDFGTGYSSLSYLKKFPIHTLKIDSAFIRGVPDNKQDCSITTAIIALAKNMDLEVIAEGVEEEAQIDFLRRHDCDLVQGFYFPDPCRRKILRDDFYSNQPVDYKQWNDTMH